MTSSRAAGQTRGCGAPRADRTTEEASGVLHRAVIAGDSHTGGAASALRNCPESEEEEDAGQHLKRSGQRRSLESEEESE